MISTDIIELIFSTARIEEVIGEVVNLKKRGSNYLGNCPFHNEKTPSFSVSPSKNIYKCFGCDVGGNVVQFVMAHDHLSYPEALRQLAKKYNIEIVEKHDPEYDEKEAEKESLYSVTDLAKKFFTDELWNSEEGKDIGLSYFEERLFSKAIIKQFELGYSPVQKDAFTQHAIKKGYKTVYLEKSGLSISKEYGAVDRFRNRVIFPIHNVSGRIVGFGGRILNQEKNLPKYLNSPESDIYHKSNILYGLFFARKEIIVQDNCYLVEGYTDVISLHQAGVSNVVSSSGTSLTVEQIRLIRRYTKNITILYDGDAAGIKASFRGIDLVLQEGMNVRIVLFPDGEDPDSFARSKPAEEIRSFIKDQSSDFIKFKTNLLSKEAEGDPVKRAGLIKEIVASIALIPDVIIRSEYIRECSSLLDIKEQTLIFELNRVLRKNTPKQHREELDAAITDEIPFEIQPIENIQSIKSQEFNIIRVLLLYGNQEFTYSWTDENNKPKDAPVKAAFFVINELMGDDYVFEHPTLQKIYEHFTQAFKSQTIPEETVFINHIDPDISNMVITMLVSPYQISDNWLDKHGIFTLNEENNLKHLVISSVFSLRLRKIEFMISDIEKKLKDVKDEDILPLMKNLSDLNRLKMAISGQLKRIVLR